MGDTHSTVPYRIIFLDIDGVLNTGWSVGQLRCPLITALAAMISAVPHCVVVLSSMWRLKPGSREKIISAFLQHGVPLFISCTPRIRYDDSSYDWRYARAHEILAWLRMNTTLEFGANDIDTVVRGDGGALDESMDQGLYRLPLRLDVSHVVALDDIDMRVEGSEMTRRLIGEGHFVLTLMSTGLTEHNVRQAQYILSDEYPAIDMEKKTTTTGGSTEVSISISTPISSDKVLLPLSDLCEECQTEKPQHYDVAINKYFCTKTCVDKFYLAHFSSHEEEKKKVNDIDTVNHQH